MKQWFLKRSWSLTIGGLVAVLLVLGCIVALQSSPRMCRGVAQTLGTYDIIRFDTIHRTDGSDPDGTVPNGMEHVDCAAYSDEIDTYSGGRSWHVVRRHMIIRTYREGVPFEFQGKTCKNGGSVIYHTRDEFVGPSEEVHPGMVKKCLALFRLSEYYKQHGRQEKPGGPTTVEATPELLKLMEEVGLPTH